MVDLFKLFRVETKEDIYPYCLLEMIKGVTNEFRRRVGLQFGFCDNPFEVVAAVAIFFFINVTDDEPPFRQIQIFNK